MKITSFEISLNSGKVTQQQTNITKYEPPVINKPSTGRTYIAKERDVYGHFLEEMFYNNELAAYTDEDGAKTQEELKEIFLEAYKHNYELRRRFKRYKETIGNLRYRYNKRKLYTQQKPVYLISLQYNSFGVIVVDGRQYYKFLSFQEAYRRCIDFKVADPRFVPPELLSKLRDRVNSADPEWQDWSVPPIRWIEQFERLIGMEAYNSVHFPVGWTREDTPIDCDL